MRLACIQMRSGIDPHANLSEASRLIREAAEQGATLIATPEMTGLLQRRPKAFLATVKSEAEDPLIPAFAHLAAELGVTLLIGSLATKVSEGRAVNRAFLFGTDGAILASYDKIHLFDVDLGRGQKWQESALYDSGNKAVLTDIDAAKLGLTICYDVRFPPLYKSLAQAGAQIIAVPAAFTKMTGQAHWETLLRARAIETGCFVMAPAQGGLHEDGRETWGHSMIIDPWGEIIAELPHGEPSILLADIDLSEVEAARAKIPAWNLNKTFVAP